MSVKRATSGEPTLFDLDPERDRDAGSLAPPQSETRARFPHTLVRASAGAGKTYRLTSRYIGLLAAGAAPGSVLASTFTRLAAGEIFDRVLVRLADAADDEARRRDLSRACGSDLTRADVLRLLRTITEHLHVIQVRTLDSFFNAVVRAFAFELGAPIDAELLAGDGAEAARLRLEAVERMLEERGADRFVPLLSLLTQGAAERSVLRIINWEIETLYLLWREASDRTLWAPVDRMETHPAAEIAEAIEEVERCALTSAKQIDARTLEMRMVRAGDWEGFLDKGIAKKIAQGETRFHRQELDQELVIGYRVLVDHAVAVLVNRLRDQSLATYDLLAAFDVHYRRVRHLRRAMTFDDLTSLVAAVADLEIGRDAIYYRIDARVRHLLLDEFQDTSVQQWRAIEPIALEVVGDETEPRTFFCVGDVKQSIYRWRDACPEVLDEIPKLLPAPDGGSGITVERISHSYRSAPAVIEVVNGVFGSVDGNPALDDYPAAAVSFASGFEKHTTEHVDMPGSVELRVARRAGPDEKQEAVRLEHTAAIIQRLHERAPGLQIAVLTRTNAAVARLLYELGPGRLEVPASGRGGAPITDAPAVNAVLDALRMADHPDDTVAAFNVARGPLGPVLGFRDERDEATRHRVARDVRRALVDDGYARTIATWTAALAPSCDERQYRRLHQLVDLAGAHDLRPSLRPVTFVRVVESQQVTEAAAAPVQVMTIHQSKGLEFDYVVLPELESSLNSKAPAVLFDRDGAAGPVTGVFRSPPEAVRPYLPAVEAMLERRRTRTVCENLSLLYVAMTRAKQGLTMIIDPPKILKSGRPSPTVPKSMAGLLREALTSGAPPEPETAIFVHGDEGWLEDLGGRDANAAIPARRPEAPRIELARGRGVRPRGRVASPASALGHERGSLRTRLRLGDAETLDRGKAVHRLFEQVEWIEDGEPEREALVDFVREASPRRDGAWAVAIVDVFLAALVHEDVRRVLSRGFAGDGPAAVWRERRYARLVGGPGATMVQEGSIDRLVVRLDDAGRPVAAKLVDFKTDAVDAAGAPAAAAGHRGQLASYREAAARLLDLEPTAIEPWVLFVIPGVAVPV